MLKEFSPRGFYESQGSGRGSGGPREFRSAMGNRDMGINPGAFDGERRGLVTEIERALNNFKDKSAERVGKRIGLPDTDAIKSSLEIFNPSPNIQSLLENDPQIVFSSRMRALGHMSRQKTESESILQKAVEADAVEHIMLSYLLKLLDFQLSGEVIVKWGELSAQDVINGRVVSPAASLQFMVEPGKLLQLSGSNLTRAADKLLESQEKLFKQYPLLGRVWMINAAEKLAILQASTETVETFKKYGVDMHDPDVLVIMEYLSKQEAMRAQLHQLVFGEYDVEHSNKDNAEYASVMKQIEQYLGDRELWKLVVNAIGVNKDNPISSYNFARILQNRRIGFLERLEGLPDRRKCYGLIADAIASNYASGKDSKLVDVRRLGTPKDPARTDEIDITVLMRVLRQNLKGEIDVSGEKLQDFWPYQTTLRSFHVHGVGEKIYIRLMVDTPEENALQISAAVGDMGIVWNLADKESGSPTNMAKSRLDAAVVQMFENIFSSARTSATVVHEPPKKGKPKKDKVYDPSRVAKGKSRPPPPRGIAESPIEAFKKQKSKGEKPMALGGEITGPRYYRSGIRELTESELGRIPGDSRDRVMRKLEGGGEIYKVHGSEFFAINVGNHMRALLKREGDKYIFVRIERN